MKNYILLLSMVIFSCSTPEEATQEKQMVSVPLPFENDASLPYLIKGDDDGLYLSWVEKGDSNLTQLKYSKLANGEWQDPQLIAEGLDWFVNWADYPMVAIDDQGNMIAHYLAKSSSGTYSYDVNIVTKSTDSTHWSNPIIPHTDGTPTEHGFVTMLPNNDGTFLLAWLDGRNTGGGDHDSPENGGAMTVRSAILNMQGTVSEEHELDHRVCDCCQTTGVITQDGPMIIYRDRSVDEIRDMAFVTKTDSTWSQPKLVANDHWKIEGCPVNGPRAVSSGTMTAVAWFTASNGNSQVKVAFKSGENFDQPIVIDQSAPIGRVDISLLDESTVIVSWMDSGSVPAIKYRTVTKEGSLSSAFLVSTISSDRGSGFPQMEVMGKDVFFAWTEMGESNQIKMKKITLKD